MKFKTGIILVFLGSVFLTSEKFVNTENAVKFYITIFALFIVLILLLLRSSDLKFELKEITSFIVLKGFYIVGIIQSIYGILQFVGKYPSNHNSFAVTGSFDNPAGFVAVLAILFPIGVFWIIKSNKLEQRLVFFSAGLILFSIIISGSRTGLLAVIFSTISIFIVEFHIFSKIRRSKQVKQIVFYSIILLLLGLSFLYKWRPDSVNGRLLIWNISTEMIKDKPLIGFGYKGFQANYMEYQAQYFEQNHHSIFKQLADNVTHPFNEFIKIAVNYGIIGLLLYLSLLSFILWKLLKSKHPQKSILLSGYISFIILSLFSYPLQYAPVSLLLSYFTLCVFSDWLQGKKFSLIIRIPIIGVCFLGIIFFSLRMNYELEWKDIALKSLQGKTKQMLPKYDKLYPYLRYNSLFLYNYSAELNVSKQYKKSIILLNECQEKYNDYDVQMLYADNYFHIGEIKKAIEIYKHAENMIPCRFLPLYYIFNIYKTSNQNEKAFEYAPIIVNKDVKIPSASVRLIISKAQEFIDKYKQAL